MAAAPVASTTGLTRALAERSSSLRYEDLPPDVLEIARQALLDWFAVTLAGSTHDAPRMLLTILPAAAQGDPGAATIVGRSERMAPLDAALLNATSSHVLDFDDVNITFLGHASVAILGAALALAEQLDRHAGELLTAFVAGYETTCRVARAIGPAPYLRGLHATGTVGTLGAAAACAHLLRLDAEQTATAAGIAASQAAGLKSNFGTMTKALHAGKACQGGLLAALLAARGFSADPRALEAEQGFAAALGGDCDTAAATADPPSVWHLRDNLFKHHAACFFTHSTIEGLRELIAMEGRPAPEQIDAIRLHVSQVELGTCTISAPRTALEVKFSLAHLAAMTLLERSTSTISDADALDAQTIDMRDRVTLVEDGAPGEPTLVELVLRGGSMLTACHDAGRPETDLDAQRVRLAAKLESLGEPVLGGAAARRLEDALLQLVPDVKVRALMALTRPGDRRERAAAR